MTQQPIILPAIPPALAKLPIVMDFTLQPHITSPPTLYFLQGDSSHGYAHQFLAVVLVTGGDL